jgi:phage terminase large subunit
LKARILLLWVDEAEPVSDYAWTRSQSRPCARKAPKSGLSGTRTAKSAPHLRFREKPPANSKIIEPNWKDNPFFTKILNRSRLDDLENRPDQYEWVWEGGFRTVVEGAYYAKQLALAKAQNRITFVPVDPLMPIRAYFDIGGTGARADAVSIWIAQFVGKKINVLDYYEAQGQPLSVHLD